eukprot:Amastigsp_a518892_5.p3 type:complete len:119 gc:universal Amastigsp_a518892_5:373-729(+)
MAAAETQRRVSPGGLELGRRPHHHRRRRRELTREAPHKVLGQLRKAEPRPSRRRSRHADVVRAQVLYVRKPRRLLGADVAERAYNLDLGARLRERGGAAKLGAAPKNRENKSVDANAR